MESSRRATWLDLLRWFGVPTVLNFIAVRIAIPFIDGFEILPIEVTYFAAVGILVLVPMFAGALYLSVRDTGSSNVNLLLRRLRVKKLSPADWAWTAGTFLLLVLSSYFIAKILMPSLGMDAAPFFFQNMPFDAGHTWILFVWPVFFFFNIFGEEFLWRGYIQPLQETLNLKWTWLVHGLFWAGWHIPMGFDLIVAATPVFFILPAVVQIRKNTSIAIIVHSVFGAFGFLALAFGFVQ